MNAAPAATHPRWLSAATRSMGTSRNAAIWKMSDRIITKLSGMPRLPQAVHSRAPKVTASTVSASATAWPWVRATRSDTSRLPAMAGSIAAGLLRAVTTVSATPTAP